MDNQTMILTKRIQLMIDCEDKEQKDAFYQQLYTWQRICYQSANIAVSHYFAQERIKDFFYLTDAIQYKLSDSKKDEAGLLTMSRMNTVYSVLSRKFKGTIPTHIISSLTLTLSKNFNSEKRELYTGERSLRNYKRDMPIPFQGKAITKFQKCETKPEFQFNLFQIPFRTYLGRDLGDKRICLENFLLNKTVLRTSSIQIKNGKLYWLAAFLHQLKSFVPDKGIIAEATLSFETPIVLSINGKKIAIGSKEDFYYKRLAIQAAIRRKQKAIAYNHSQHGRKRKMKSIDQYKEKEQNFVKHTLHVYSAKMIEVCKKYDVGVILLKAVAAAGMEENDEEQQEEKNFILRNWSYYALTDKIRYKALKAGIEVIVE